MRIGVDLDGCLVDFITDARKACTEFYETSEQFIPEPNCWEFPVKQWGLSYEDFWDAIRYGVHNLLVWHDSPPVQGGLECLNSLREDGHTLHICTSRPGFEEVTFQWLKRFEVPYDSVTISDDKTVVDVDMFIDDSPHNLEALVNNGTDTIRFVQPWNDGINVYDHWSAENWEDVREIVNDQLF